MELVTVYFHISKSNLSFSPDSQSRNVRFLLCVILHKIYKLHLKKKKTHQCTPSPDWNTNALPGPPLSMVCTYILELYASKLGRSLRSQLVCPLFLLVQVRISLNSLPDRQGFCPLLGEEVRAVAQPYNPCLRQQPASRN